MTFLTLKFINCDYFESHSNILKVKLNSVISSNPAKYFNMRHNYKDDSCIKPTLNLKKV